MTSRDDKINTAANKSTALTALAARGRKPGEGCISSEEMAALVAGNLAQGERQHCLDHLAFCQSCYDEWRILSLDEMTASGKIIKGPWFNKRSFSFTAAGSLLAAAAVVILYLNLNQPMVYKSMEPSPMVVVEERGAPAEIVIDERLRSAAKAPSPPVVQKAKAARQELGSAAEQEKQEKDSMAEFYRAVPAPEKNKKVASRPKRRVVANLDEEKTVVAGFASLISENEIMVDIGNVIPLVLKKMTQLGEGESLVLQTFKRDRSLTLVRLAENRVLIKEDGFLQKELEIDSAKLAKTLKTLLKKEFPRSKKVRISFGDQPGQ